MHPLEFFLLQGNQVGVIPVVIFGQQPLIGMYRVPSFHCFVCFRLHVSLKDTLPKMSPNRSFRPNAWKNEIFPRPKMVGTNQLTASSSVATRQCSSKLGIVLAAPSVPK